MKKTILFLFGSLLINIAFCQSLTPEVIVTSGDYFSETNASISWTLGEIATETFISGNTILTQGFQQPVEGIIISGIDLDLLVYLEGPFTGGQMTTNLNNAGEIPLTQPFNTVPWNYNGTEFVAAIPNIDIVDWVLIELRDAADAASAIGTTTIAQQAAFLLKNGSVVGIDGSSILEFNHSLIQSLFVVVWHRSHLGILSANAIPESEGVFNYDFSTALTQVYNGGAGYKEIATNVFGMVGGDANADGSIGDPDKALWSNNAGTKGYKPADYDMDTQVTNKDKNNVWIPNRSYNTQVPE